MPEPTYTDYVELRRSGDAPASPPSGDNVRYFSDEDGVLRYLLADGSTGIVGGAGGSQAGAARWVGPHVAWGNLLQTVDMTGDPPDAGTFTLIYNGEETTPLAWNATSDDLKAALSALPSLAGIMQVSCYDHASPPNLGSFPASVLSVVLTNTPARPLALTVGNNSLTAADIPVADPVVEFDAAAEAWYCIADLSEGEIVEDVFVALIESFSNDVKAGAYTAGGDFLFPVNQYIPLSTTSPVAVGDFTNLSEGPMTAQMTDAPVNAGAIPTLVLADADLFWNVKDRSSSSDDSVGQYKLYVKRATPSLTP